MRRLTRGMLLLGSLAASQVFAQNATFHVLAYHDVRDAVTGDYDPDQYAVSVGALIDHFTWLELNGFVPVSVDDLLAARSGARPLPDKAVLLTFDDGLESFYTRVYPLLELFDYPAVLSLVTEWTDGDPVVRQGGRTFRREDFMTWDQVREVAASGRVEIASHSHALHVGIKGNPQGNEQPAAVTLRYADGRYETEAEQAARIDADLARSVQLIEENTGRAPRIITWPFGAHSAMADAIAARRGMAIGITLTDGVNEVTDLRTLRRNLIQANPGVEALAYALLQPPGPSLVRAAQVDLDYVYDPDPARQEQNLGRLLDRIQALEITHVFLQAFADPDADGGAQSVYFPNRHLPVRADLFNRAAWQLKTRSNVRVYAWMPLLSFGGDSIDPAWRVQQTVDGVTGFDPAGEPRLSPFVPKAVGMIRDLYRDLARHASFDGILFHDDGRFNEHEDTNPAAMRAYREAFGSGFSLEDLERDPTLRRRWARLRSAELVQLSNELAAVVRQWRPDARTARNLFAGAVLDAEAPYYLAQSYPEFLAAYDHVALMAMPRLEGVANAERFYEALARGAVGAQGGVAKTIFELQTIDWSTGRRIPDASLEHTLRWLQSLGIRHLAYYPDDFIESHPSLDALRRGMSVAVYPNRAAP